MDAQKVTNKTISSRGKIPCAYLFVGSIPFQVDRLHLAKQVQVEFFLNPKMLKDIGINPTETQTGEARDRYVT